MEGMTLLEFNDGVIIVESPSFGKFKTLKTKSFKYNSETFLKDSAGNFIKSENCKNL